MFPLGDRNGLGSLYSPGALRAHERGEVRPFTRSVAFWLKLISQFSLLTLTTFIKSSHMLTIPSTLGPLRFRLADTHLPHGFCASLSTLGPLSEGLLSS